MDMLGNSHINHIEMICIDSQTNVMGMISRLDKQKLQPEANSTQKADYNSINQTLLDFFMLPYTMVLHHENLHFFASPRLYSSTFIDTWLAVLHAILASFNWDQPWSSVKDIAAGCFWLPGEDKLFSIISRFIKEVFFLKSRNWKLWVLGPGYTPSKIYHIIIYQAHSAWCEMIRIGRSLFNHEVL